MKLRSLNKFISLIILTLSFSKTVAEEQIDIWDKAKKFDRAKHSFKH